MGFLAGKTAIITGAGYAKLINGRCGSIGYGIATAYAKEGANLVITGRNVKKLTDAKEELERLYGVKVVCVVPADTHKNIVYPAALTSQCANTEAAQAFVDFCMTDPDALAIWQSYGFELA